MSENRYFQVVSSHHNPPRAQILIRRKPSELPGRLDLNLLKIAGSGSSDPEKRFMTWDFLCPESLPDATLMLRQCGWDRIYIRDTDLYTYEVCSENKGILGSFEDREEAEEYLQSLLLRT